MGCGFESHRGHDVSWVAPVTQQELAEIVLGMEDKAHPGFTVRSVT